MSFGRNDMHVRIGSHLDPKGFNQAEKRMKSFAGRGRRMLGALAGGLGAYGGARLLAGGLRHIGSVDTALREVNSLLGLSRDEFQGLQDDILGVSSSLKTNAVSGVKAAYQAISAGVSRGDVSDFLTVATKTGIAGIVDTEVAVDGLTTAVNAYGDEAKNAERYADMMFAGVKEGKTRFGELAESMYLAAPMAATFGVPFEELIAGVAAITKRGAPTAAAFTQIKSGLVAMTKPTDDMEKALKRLGYQTGQELIAAKGYQGALNALRGESVRMGVPMTKLFGRTEAMNAVFNLTGEGAAEFKRILGEVKDSSGDMAGAFEINNQGVERSMDRIVNAMKTKAEEAATFWVGLYDAMNGKGERAGDVPGRFAEGLKKAQIFGLRELAGWSFKGADERLSGAQDELLQMQQARARGKLTDPGRVPVTITRNGQTAGRYLDEWDRPAPPPRISITPETSAAGGSAAEQALLDEARRHGTLIRGMTNELRNQNIEVARALDQISHNRN